VNAKVDPNKDTFDQEFAALAESSKQAITQYNAETKYLGTITPADWVSSPYRQSQGWPQRLWQLKEAYEKQEADKEAQSGGDNPLLNEVKALKEQVAKLLEAQNASAEEKPAEPTEETKPEASEETEEKPEDKDEEGETEEAPEEEA